MYKPPVSRSVAQPGRAPRSGRGGRRFKSCHSDQPSPPSSQARRTSWGMSPHARLVYSRVRDGNKGRASRLAAQDRGHHALSILSPAKRLQNCVEGFGQSLLLQRVLLRFRIAGRCAWQNRQESDRSRLLGSVTAALAASKSASADATSCLVTDRGLWSRAALVSASAAPPGVHLIRPAFPGGTNLPA